MEDSREPVDPLKYAAPYHAPVLCHAVVEGLVTRRDGLYVDGTLGGGGHTAALLDALAPEGRVLGLDQDAEALEAVRLRLGGEIESGRLVVVQSNFADIESVLENRGGPPVQGILLDLGVSSHQFDASARGFSFSGAGRLDMRMDAQSGHSADEVVNGWTEGELRRLFFTLGEEPRSKKIARAVVQARPLESTHDLADVIRQAAPGPEATKTLARVFQAIRIVVNRELERLEDVLRASVRVVEPGGRMAVISYHSLEDRRVKHFFRYGNLEGKPERDVYGNLIAPWRPLTRRPVTPDAREVALNSRARSARLRIAERVPFHRQTENRHTQID